MKKYLVLGLVLVGVLFVNSMTAFAVVSHVINASAGAGGTINPSGLVTVTHGSNKTFTITPNAGYIVSNVLVDSTSVGRANSYRFNNVISDQVISATFDSGWSAPSHFANNNGVTGPSYVYSSDNQYAVFNNQNDRVDYYGFGLSVPNNATINGLELAFEANRPSPRTVNFSFSTDGGTTWTTGSGAKNSGSVASADTTYILGSSSDLWNRTWVPSDFANLRVRVDAQTTGPGDTLNIDQIQVKVHYTVDTIPPSGGSVSYTDGYFNVLSVPVTYTLGTDSESGLNNASGKLQRASATLSPSGSCGSFGSFSDLATDFSGSYTDTSVVTGYCYKYQYQISDNLGNTATYTSASVVKIDTVPPVISVNSSLSVNVEYGSTYYDYDATATDSVSDAGVDTSTFVPLHQENRGWTRLAVAPNGDVFATVLGDDIYVKRNGTNDFVPLNQPHLAWIAIAVSPVNGNVYASAFDREGAGVYMQTGGTGDFVKISDINPIAGLTVAPNGNVYAAQIYGKIYMQTGGVGDFTPIPGVAHKTWTNLAATPDGNVYATTYNQDYLYIQTGGTGDFVALSAIAQRTWGGITVSSSGDVYAVAYTNNNHNFYDSYIYKRIGGTGDFLPLGQGGQSWSAIASSLGNSDVYAIRGSNTVYEKTYADIYQLKLVTLSESISLPVVVGGSVNTNVLGDYVITYDATDAAGNSAVQQTRTVHVIKRAITITTDPNQGKIFGQTDPTLTYHITDGSLAPSDSFVGSLSRAEGEDVGSYPITRGTLGMASGDNYNVTFTGDQFTITSAEAVITINATDLNPTYNGSPKPVSATTNPASLPFDLTYNGESLAPTNAGTYTVVATVTDPNYSGTDTKTLTIHKANQSALSITGLPESATYGQDGIIAGTEGGNGTGAVIFSVGESNACLVNSETGAITITRGTGVCIITVDKAGDENYNSASVSASLTVHKANQTITFNELGDKTMGDPDFSVSGTAGSGLPVTFTVSEGSTCSIVEGPMVHLLAVGTCTITAHQGGNDNYNPAEDVSRSFNIKEASQGGGGSTVPPPSSGGGGAHGVLPVGQVLGASTVVGTEIAGCGMRTTGYSTVSGVSCEHNKPHSEGEVLGVEKFIFTQYMRRGLKRSEVPELQKRLTVEGFYTGPIDGKFGPLTDKAVREYQKANPPLRIDGIVGPKTRAVLNK